MAWIIPNSAYHRPKDPTFAKKHRGSHGGVQTAPKAKLPTSMKSKPCSFCKNPAITTVVLGDNKYKNTRRLCKDHANDFKRRNLKYSAKFEKASDLFDS